MLSILLIPESHSPHLFVSTLDSIKAKDFSHFPLNCTPTPSCHTKQEVCAPCLPKINASHRRCLLLDPYRISKLPSKCSTNCFDGRNVKLKINMPLESPAPNCRRVTFIFISPTHCWLDFAGFSKLRVRLERASGGRIHLLLRRVGFLG